MKQLSEALLTELLESEGYNVIEARNGEAALNTLSTVRPDLILLDLQMPVMSGWTFLQELRAAAISLPIIIMSAQMHSVKEAVKLGALDLLEKPFEVDDLLTRVAKYAHPHSAPSEVSSQDGHE